MDARGDIQGIQRALIRGSRFVLWAVLPIQVGLVVLGKPFLTLWMGQRYAASSYPTLVILALPLALVITQAVGAIALYGNRSTSLVLPGDHCRGCHQLASQRRAACLMGIEGVASGTTIPNLAFNGALMVYVCRRFGISLLNFVREVYVRPSLLACLLAIGWALTTSLIPPRTWPMLIGTGRCGLLAYGAVAVVVEFGPELVIRVVNTWFRALARESRLWVYRTTPVDNCDARRWSRYSMGEDDLALLNYRLTHDKTRVGWRPNLSRRHRLR